MIAQTRCLYRYAHWGFDRYHNVCTGAAPIDVPWGWPDYLFAVLAGGFFLGSFVVFVGGGIALVRFLWKGAPK